MRAILLSLSLGVSGCVAPVAFQTQPIARAPVPCEPAAILAEGRNERAYPVQCQGDAALFESYRLGLRIAQLEEEKREINYLIASRDGRGPIGAISTAGSFRGFGAGGYLISRRVDVTNELNALKREAGLK